MLYWRIGIRFQNLFKKRHAKEASHICFFKKKVVCKHCCFNQGSAWFQSEGAYEYIGEFHHIVYRFRKFPLQLLAFRGAGGEPPRRKRLWGLTCPANPAGVSHFRYNQHSTDFVLQATYPLKDPLKR